MSPSYPDCGRQAHRALQGDAVYERIHVRGCVTVIGQVRAVVPPPRPWSPG